MDLDRLGTLLVAGPLIGAGLVRRGPGIPILMYHSISDDPEPGVRSYFRLATSPSRFREQMHGLRDSGHVVISLDEAVRRVEAGHCGGEKVAVLTFDDGFRDFRSGAWPTLLELSFTSTVFLPTAFIGASPQKFKGRECLTWNEVRELHHSGIHFGTHTVNHPKLHGLSWVEITHELTESRERVEQELSAAVTTFAYPYAFPQEDRPFVDRFRSVLRQTGYTGAVTTVVGRAKRGGDPLCLKRLPVNECDDPRLFEKKLTGAYDWVGAAQAGFRQLKHVTGGRAA